MIDQLPRFTGVGDNGEFSDFIGGRGDESDPHLKPPINVRSETPQNNSNYLLATSGGFIQAFLYGATGLRIQQDDLVPEFAPILPKELSDLKLMNIKFRGRAIDLMISRARSGRIVRHVTAKTTLYSD